MRLKGIAALVLIAVAAGSIYFYNGVIKSEIDQESINSKVINHLQDKGYRDGDYTVDVSYHWERKLFGNNHNPYVIKVTFKDEPSVLYYYTYNFKSAGKEVTQSAISPTEDRPDKNFKHME